MRRLTALSIIALCWSAVVVAAEPDILIADFQKNPLPKDWQVEGYAFGSRAPGTERQQAAKTTANQRQYRFGTLTSPEFVIERDYLVMGLGGVYHPEKCCMALMIEGRDVRRVSPGASPGGWATMDVRELDGKSARLQARDRHFNGWVTLGRVFQADQPKGPAQKEIPSWEPAVFEAEIDGPFLLLPVGGAKAPIQSVTVEIDGEPKLSTDMALAMADTENFLPTYDLTRFQGKTLRVRYHQTVDSRTDQLIRLGAIPTPESGDGRPAFHVHCRFGRLNDPNGLVFHDGRYHLFHQYYFEVRAKHWAHHVSTDLVHWRERPIALFPDETGSMHSGSAAVDLHDSGGLQKGDTAPIIAAFTGSRGLGGGDKIQVQGIAYSTDGGHTFTKYAGNPVIGEPHMDTLKSNDSRDPKIFWYSPTLGMDPAAEDGYWIMVLFEDGGHSIFRSDDLKSWKKCGSIQGFHECPELFPLAVDGNRQEIRWIMYGGSGNYHIGSFDGRSFQPETAKRIRLNHGGFYYAAQTFSNTPGSPPRRIQVGWQGAQISFPVELSLRTTPLGLRVCALPVREIANLYDKIESLDGRTLEEADANPLASFRSGLYDVELDARLPEAAQVELDVRGKTIRYDAESRKLTCEKRSVTLPEQGQRLALRVVVDHCSIDVFAGEHGLFYMPMYFRELKSKELALRIQGKPVRFERLRVRRLKPGGEEDRAQKQ